MEEFYSVLSVSRDASEKDIRQAYRRLARQHHPDVNPANKEAEERFKRINEAYEVLSDPESRAKYDRYGSDWKHAEEYDRARAARDGTFDQWMGDGSGFGLFSGASSAPDHILFEDLLSELGRSRVEYSVEITLEEAFEGATRYVEIPLGASGAPPRRLEVRIPPGVDTGARIRVPAGDGRRQDIYLHVVVCPHPKYRRSGADLYTEVDVPVVDAVLGGEVPVATLKGKLMLKVPPETQNGQSIRLSGRGMTHLDNPKVRGDLYATVKVALPSGLTDDERRLFGELRDLRANRRR